jgi:hypothetical protein
MNPRRREVGDDDNTEFETVDPASHHVRPGFDRGDETSPTKEGEVRFPHRRPDEGVPRVSLADRLRSERRGTP